LIIVLVAFFSLSRCQIPWLIRYSLPAGGDALRTRQSSQTMIGLWSASRRSYSTWKFESRATRSPNSICLTPYAA